MIGIEPHVIGFAAFVCALAAVALLTAARDKHDRLRRAGLVAWGACIGLAIVGIVDVFFDII